MNLIKIQDDLKNLSDAQLAQEMRMPSGLAPQFLVMSEMGRREKMRAEAASDTQAPQTSIAEEMVAQAQPQGIMGLPDETLAGAAMRARISGQQQQTPDGTVNPPGAPQQGAPQPAAMARGGHVRYMADGGSAQYGGLFKPVEAPQTYPTSPTTQAVTFSAPVPTVAQPQTPAPVPQQVVPADRYGRHENPVLRQTPEQILASLSEEQRRRLSRLNPRFWSGVGGVGGVGSAAASAAGSAAGGVGAGGVGGAGVGGAGFAEGGPIRLSAGTPEPLYTPDQIVRTLTDQDLSRLAAGDSEFEPFDLGGRSFSLSRDLINREASRRGEQSAAGRLVDRYLASGVRGPMAERQYSSDRGLFNYPTPMLNRMRDASLSAGHAVGDFFTKPTNTRYGKEDPMFATSGPRPAVERGAIRADDAKKLAAITPEQLAAMSSNAPPSTPMIPEVLTRAQVPGKGTPKSAPTSGMPDKGTSAPSESEAVAAASPMKDYAGEYMGQYRSILDRLGGDVDKTREDARSNAIMKAGLAMMASKDPNFLAAIGEGAQAGLGEWAEAKKDLRKEELARASAEMEALGKAAQLGQSGDISSRQIAFDERQLAAQTGLKERELAETAGYHAEQNALQERNIQRYIDISQRESEDAARRDLLGRIEDESKIMGDMDVDPKERENASRRRDALVRSFDTLYPRPGVSANVIGRDNLSQEMINSPWFQKQLAAHMASRPGQ